MWRTYAYKKIPTFFVSTCLVQACASLYHVQVGDVDSRQRPGRSIDIKVSEVGVNLKEAGRIMRAASRSREASKMFDYLTYLQMGPRTGNPVYDENYAKPILKLIYQECPSGQVTGLLSVRENVKYPVISGEIVKVTAWCLD